MTQEQNPSWSFKLDEVSEWAFWDQAFTPEECEQIIEEGKKRTLSPGNIDRNKLNTELRKSNVSWITPTNEFFWVYQRVTDIILELNSKYFRFDLFGITEPFQFTEYTDDNGHYSKHVDRKSGFVVRKLSVSIQLTDPSTYVGGELLLYFEDEPAKTKTEQGALIVFPSYTLHEVTPVTQGTRYSLVAWVTGKNFT